MRMAKDATRCQVAKPHTDHEQSFPPPRRYQSILITREPLLEVALHNHMDLAYASIARTLGAAGKHQTGAFDAARGTADGADKAQAGSTSDSKSDSSTSDSTRAEGAPTLLAAINSGNPRIHGVHGGVQAWHGEDSNEPMHTYVGAPGDTRHCSDRRDLLRASSGEAGKTCGQFDGHPDECDKARVGRTPCVYSGGTCRRSMLSSGLCQDTKHQEKHRPVDNAG